MEKNKMKGFFESLEKLCVNRGTGRLKEDDIAQFRSCTQRILTSLESSSERGYRDIVLKNNGNVTLLITTLQLINDKTVLMNVVKIFSDLIGKTNMGRRAQVICQAGGTQALFNVMLYESKESTPSEEFLFLLHHVLYKLGLKDRKFSSKARLCQVLPVTLNLLRQMSGSGQLALMSSTTSKNLQLILNIIKLYSGNQHNSSTLGRNGAVTYLLRVLLACGKKHLTLLKITLDTLHAMVKTKSNSARAVGQGAITLLMESFLDWHKSDTKNKQLAQKKAILNVLKQLVNLKSGRRALIEHNGLFSLYEALITIKHNAETEPLVTTISQILRRCFPRNRLPVGSYDSVLQCPLPTSAIGGDNTAIKGKLAGTGENVKNALDYGDESPIDEDDDLSSDDGLDDDLELGPSGSLPLLVGGSKPVGKSNLGSIQSTSFSGKAGANKSKDSVKPSNQSNKQFASIKRLNADSECSNYPDQDSYSSPINLVKIERSLDDLSRDYEQFFHELVEFPKPKITILDVSDHNVTNQLNDNNSTEKSCLTANSLQRGMKKSYSTPIFNLNSNFESTVRNSFSKTSESSNGEDSKLHRSLTGHDMFSLQNRSPIRTKQRATPPNLKNISQQSNLSDIIQISNAQSLFMTPTADNGKSQSVRRGSLSSNQKSSPQKCNSNSLKKRNSQPISIQMQGGDTAEPPLYLSNDKINKPGFSAGDSAIKDAEEEEEDGYRNEHTAAYMSTSATTRSLSGYFSVLGYPDLIGCKPNPHSEIFHEKKKSGQMELQHNKLHEDFRRVVDPSDVKNKIVFDLDAITADQEKFRKQDPDYKLYFNNSDQSMGLNQSLSNVDEISIDQIDYRSNHLIFESRFESGNLRKAIQVRQYEYDLVLNPDINTNHHVQWFYFRVSNIESDVPYRFNIINCEKPNSQFNFGMKPVLFSVKESLFGRTYWRRIGTEICYYKNHFVRSVQTTGGIPGRTYYTATFVVTFPHEGDVCYLAYHYPYTYSHLMSDIELWKKKVEDKKSTVDKNVLLRCCNNGDEMIEHDSIYFKVQQLTKTLLGNSLPLLTITATPKSTNNEALRQFHSRPYIYLTSRVHPGESNASWVMRGTISYLLSNCEQAKQLRTTYIFKIIPMLNPDGVIMGCHRCSMSGEDLNRRWLEPCSILHPTIYHAKGIALYLTKIGKSPLVYCDYHGHSRKKNVFMYGCSCKQSWLTEDTDNPAYIDVKSEDTGFRTLPRILQGIAPAFSLGCCSFSVEKAKESTARVVVWRECRVLRSYTMESSYCGFDQGRYKGYHLSSRELEEMGGQFGEGLLKMNFITQSSQFGRDDGMIGDGPAELGDQDVEGAAAAKENDEFDLDFDCPEDEDQIDSDGDNWSEPSDNEVEDEP